MKIKKIKFLECLRCGHEWIPRNKNKKPKQCPRCKNKYWNHKRQKEIIDEILKNINKNLTF